LFYDPKNQKDFEDVEMICGTISENEKDELLTISDTEDAARNPRNLQLLHNGIHWFQNRQRIAYFRKKNLPRLITLFQ
jgi:hypothetical protein